MEGKKVRIGILTYHKSINYGAFMQCYSLVNKLKKDFPHEEIEVIDYVTKRTYDRYRPTYHNYFSTGSRIKNVIKLLINPRIISQKKALYRAFMSNWKLLPLSNQSWVTDDYQLFLKDIYGKYDIVIVGSDCIWEYIHYPFPNAYFVNRDIGAVKMSYAGSFDRVHYSKMTSDEKNYVKESMHGFSYLGVRDRATEQLLQKLDSTLSYSHNCDPSFVLDLDSLESYKQSVAIKLVEHGIDLKSPIIGVMGGEKLARVVKKNFGGDYQIVSVFYKTKSADGYIEDLEPLEWATIFSFFDLTFTRFFHGSIYSLLNGTPTITIDDWKKEDSSHLTKLEDLYMRLNLSNHLFRVEDLDSTEGIKKIIKAASLLLKIPDKNEIASAIIKESDTYNIFRDRLTQEVLSLKNGK